MDQTSDLNFNKLYSLIGKDVNDSQAKEFFDSIHSHYKDYFIIHEPEESDIENDNDKWKCYDSYQELGIFIEIVCGIVACVSFSGGVAIYDEPNDIPAYPYSVYKNLKIGKSRKELIKILGTPKKKGDFFDQYAINNKITMGILYNQNDHSANTYSFGLTEIFSDPDRIPNRLDSYPNITNIMGGSGSNDFGPMNALEIVNKYHAEVADFNTDTPDRFGFVGHEVDPEIQALYLRKRVPDEYRKRGTANPVKYRL